MMMMVYVPKVRRECWFAGMTTMHNCLCTWHAVGQKMHLMWALLC
jgi:hypothetical protein